MSPFFLDDLISIVSPFFLVVSPFFLDDLISIVSPFFLVSPFFPKAPEGVYPKHLNGDVLDCRRVDIKLVSRRDDAGFYL